MPRIAPDSNDIIVMTLTDGPGTYINTGTSGATDNWTEYGAPVNTTDQVQYFKLRTYDLSCPTPIAVTWVDTEISLTNAPAFPCAGPYSTPEILDTWFA